MSLSEDNYNYTEAYLPFHKKEFILMHDNARPHVSDSTDKFLKAKNIRTLEWPASSPDCNPIENLWGVLTHRIYFNKKYDNLDDLQRAISREWDSLTLNEIEEIVDSFPNRLIAVVGVNGAEIKRY